MKWKPTWLLVLLAAALFAFIFLFERFQTPTAFGTTPAKRIVQITPAEVTNVQLRITNQLVLRAERAANGNWNLVAPFTYPAQVYAIEGLLQNLTELTAPTSISPEELASGGKTVADFGLDVPQATLTLMHGGRRTEVLFGSKTPAGDQVYVQLLNQPAIYLVNSEVANRLPRQANDWRDTTLLHFAALSWDRMEVRLPGQRGFALQLDRTNKFVLSKPLHTRANIPKVEALLRNLLVSRVAQFVSDESQSDLEPYGLQAPEAELVLGSGTNDLATIQFGKSPTNNANLVYARLPQKNIVLVPKGVLEALQVSANDLRDRHLFSFSTNEVDTVEVSGAENFAVRRQYNGLWVVIEPQATLIDADLMNNLLASLQQLEGNVEKDVVTDFKSFGLAPPARQYWLKTTVTNAAGVVTNRIVAQLDCSAPQQGKVFVRRGDEAMTVYSIPSADFEALPAAAWQLRDRRVWTFATNQVMQVTVSQRGVSRTLVRNGGKWTLAEGSQGVINPAAVEELMYRLGELRADLWVARGDNNRAQYGFTGEGAKMTLDLKAGDKPYRLQLELGGTGSGVYPYALATVDGQSWIFKFPLKLYFELLRDLVTPLTRNSSGTL